MLLQNYQRKTPLSSSVQRHTELSSVEKVEQILIVLRIFFEKNSGHAKRPTKKD